MKDPPSLKLWWTGKAGYVTSYQHVTLTLQGTTPALQAGEDGENFDSILRIEKMLRPGTG
jgi:hypothetical protein